MEHEVVSALDWAQTIAAELGPGWTAQPADWGRNHAYLNGPDAQQVHVSLYDHYTKPRVRLGWSFPSELKKHVPYDHHAQRDTEHEITVSRTKTPAQVVGDITRRLLPGLTDLIAASTRLKTEHDKAIAERDAFLTELSAMLNGRPPRDGRCSFSGYPNLPRGHVDATRSYVELNLELTRRQTHDMLALVAQMEASTQCRRPRLSERR